MCVCSTKVSCIYLGIIWVGKQAELELNQCHSFSWRMWQGGKDKAVEGIHERVNYGLLARLGRRWAYKEVTLFEEGILSVNLREVKKVSQCRVRQSDLERVDLVVGVWDGWIVGNDGFTPLVWIRSRNVCLRKDGQDTCEEERGQGAERKRHWEEHKHEYWTSWGL